MSKQKNGLSKKERLFCVYYAHSADVKQSALKAGFKTDPEENGIMLLSDQKVADYVMSILKTRENVLSYMALLGYEKLAFSGISDAISLLYMDKPKKETLESMNLLNISEIKKLKDGAMEIKFFDRLKAIDNLSDTKHIDHDGATSLVDALCMGAEKLRECECDDFGV